MSKSSWKIKILTIVLLPTVAAVLIAGVSVFRGYLHRKVGFDAEGRPLASRAPSAGPPGPTEPSRRPLSTTALITRIREDIGRVEASDQLDTRYFSLAHRHNDPAVTTDILERERQAFRELVRLLSPADRSPRVTAIDEEQVVFRLRLPELGWADDQWRELVRHYPYGVSQTCSTDTALREADDLVRSAVEDQVPIVRADWFVAALVRPPLGGPGGTLGLWTKTPPANLRLVSDAYAGQTVGLEVAAKELGVEPGLVSKAIEGDERLRESFGLGPLARGQTFLREWWESDKNLTSPFQELARRLGLGKPVVRR
jgi:hypothetical protein